MDTENKKGPGARFLNWLKTFTLRKVVLMLTSLFFALVLWGYILTTQNPERVRTLQNVAVRFTGEQELANRNLVVVGNRQELLQKIEVNVHVRLNTYWMVTAENVTATIDLSSISTPGVYPLTIRASSSYGTVDVKKPIVSIEVDDLVTKNVPVEAVRTGTLPNGYWMSEPELSSPSLDIQGPKQEVERIRKAVCAISLDGRTQSYNDSLEVGFVDDMGEAIFSHTIPAYSINAKLDIFPKKRVEFDLGASISGMDRLSPNYEIINITTTPASVEIAGPQDVLDAINALEFEQRSVAGATESVQADLEINMPEGVVWSDAKKVSVFIEIQEKRESVVFEDIPITIIGLDRKLVAEPSFDKARVSITGPVSIVSKLTRRDVSLRLDLTALTKGTYMLGISPSLPSDVEMDKIFIEMNPQQISLVIKDKA